MADLTAIPQSQQRVASLVASGLMDKEIARNLGISPGAVKDRVERPLRYAGVRNRVQLTVWWLRQTGQLRETVQ